MGEYFEDGGTWRRIAEEGRLMVFERVGDPSAEREIRMCGVFDDVGQLALVFNTIQMARLEGALHVSASPERTVLYFRRGNLLAARSTLARDRLGHLLVESQRATADVVNEVLDGGGRARAALGKTLVQRGILTTQDVYAALREQVERIVFSTLRFRRGTYCLIAPLEMSELPAFLHLDSQKVLLDALRRVDEAQERKPREQEAGADELFQAGLQRRENSDKGALDSMVDAHNRALLRLFSSLTRDVGAQLRDEVERFLRAMEACSPALQNVSIRKHGVLDSEQLSRNLETLGPGGVHHLQSALSELLLFVVFAVADSAGEDASTGQHRGIAEALECVARGAL